MSTNSNHGPLFNSILSDIKTGKAQDPRIQAFYRDALDTNDPLVQKFLRFHGKEIGFNAVEKTAKKLIKGEAGVDKQGQKHSLGCQILYCLDQAAGQAAAQNVRVASRYLWGAVRKLDYSIPKDVFAKLDFGQPGLTAEFLANWVNDNRPDLFNQAMHCTCDHEGL